MKLALLAVVGLGLLIGVAFLLARRSPDRTSREAQGATDKPGPTVNMREALLTGNAAQFGITPVGPVWGVLMEIGFPEAWASLVSLGDGSASLYTRKGGGVIGGGGHEPVRRAAMNVCAVAAGLAASGEKVTTFRHPGAGRIRFYVLTDDGVRTAEDRSEALRSPAHPLHDLFVAADRAMTELRQVSERASSGPASSR